MIKTTKDGRTILDGKDYTRFRRALWEAQEGECSNCHLATSTTCDLEYDHSFHVDHKTGRGIGGGKRDDTFAACRGLCGKCHRLKHNQGIREKAQHV